MATSIVRSSVYLEPEKERFDVRSAQWAANLRRDTAVVAHLKSGIPASPETSSQSSVMASDSGVGQDRTLLRGPLTIG